MGVENEKQKIGTCVVVIDSQERVLLGKRLTKIRCGHYRLPGGTLEIDESPIGCAKRELVEETNLQPGILTCISVILDHQGPPTNDFVHFVYLCKNPTGELILMEPAKCESWKWYPINNLPDPIVPAHLAAIKHLASVNDTDSLVLLEIYSKSSNPNS
jgi:8-oxo-dGTP diphosphatase